MSNLKVKEYKVEYLCTLDTDSEFCSTVNGLKSLLESYERLELKNNKIMWQGHEFDLNIDHGQVLNSNHKFFHLILVNKKIEKQEIFLNLLRVIRTILNKVNNNQPPEILWDDISSELAIKSYPIIHEIENLMRKLITKFMVTKVGLNWTQDNIPEIVRNSLNSKKGNGKQNYIYNTDFIQLSNFLFNEYTSYNDRQYIDMIKMADNINQLQLDDLKKIVPQSNWTRYFAPIIKTSSEDIKVKWNNLYELRCKVAHNNFMQEKDFINISEISNYLKNILSDAISKLDEVKISEDDKEELVENAAINLNKAYGEFIVNWKTLDSKIKDKFILKNSTDRGNVNVFYKNFLYKYLSEEDYNDIKELRLLRNVIINQSNIEITEAKILESIKKINLLISKIENIKFDDVSLPVRFIISKDENKKIYFRLSDYNNEILFYSKSYNKIDELMEDIELIKSSDSSIINFGKIDDNLDDQDYCNLYVGQKEIGKTLNIYNGLIRSIKIVQIRTLVKKATIENELDGE